MIVDYDGFTGLYLIAFRLRFDKLGERALRVLKRSKALVIDKETILVLASKFDAGIIMRELLEENVYILYPNVAAFRIEFEYSAIREAGVIQELSSRLSDVPILASFSAGEKLYLVVPSGAFERVEAVLSDLKKPPRVARNRAFLRTPYTPRSAS